MVSEIFDMSKKKSAFDVLTLAVMAGQIFLFFSLPTKVKRFLFLLIFIFWRAGYNAGLGYLLKLQSERRGLVAWAREAGIFDKNRGNPWYDWLKVELSCKMESDYDFDVSVCFFVQRRNASQDLTVVTVLILFVSPFSFEMEHRLHLSSSTRGCFTVSWST
jgi:hypothetical protein